MNIGKALAEVMADKAARYLRDKSDVKEGPDAFDLSFAMEILTGIPKQAALDMILYAGKKLENSA